MELRIGICEKKVIEVILNGMYKDAFGSCYSGRISFANETLLVPQTPDCYFELPQVTIGKQFHWQSNETQRFKGAFECVKTDCGFAAVNRIDIEEYLKSVISSEMSANAPLELLKAQCVIARSWAMRQVQHKRTVENEICCINSENRLIKWFENSSHKYYDICADDHCQRYYGFMRSHNPNVDEAVKQTRNQVLTYNGELCDARYHKACGGVTERYSTAWDDIDYPYLQPITDDERAESLDLSDEAAFREWLNAEPAYFCNVQSDENAKNYLNSFDLNIPFYRWSFYYTAEQLSELINSKSDMDFGSIKKLEAVKRGASGRICELLIEGSRKSMIVGKELEIRRLLSPSHLYSSAFVVNSLQNAFEIKGSGWGHGVGLCQIGAAAMAYRGYDYVQILQHYYKGAELARVGA